MGGGVPMMAPAQFVRRAQVSYAMLSTMGKITVVGTTLLLVAIVSTAWWRR